MEASRRWKFDISWDRKDIIIKDVGGVLMCHHRDHWQAVLAG